MVVLLYHSQSTRSSTNISQGFLRFVSPPLVAYATQTCSTLFLVIPPSSRHRRRHGPLYELMECLTFSRRPRSRVGPQSCCENGHSLLPLRLRRVLEQLTVRSVDLRAEHLSTVQDRKTNSPLVCRPQPCCSETPPRSKSIVNSKKIWSPSAPNC